MVSKHPICCDDEFRSEGPFLMWEKRVGGKEIMM